jgi:AhpC/TSA family
VIFMCNHCPYVQAALPRIVREARELAALGIGTVGINSNDAAAYPEDSFKLIVAPAAEQRLPFPYLHDETQQVARAYGAMCTPEFQASTPTCHCDTAAGWILHARIRFPTRAGNCSKRCSRSRYRRRPGDAVSGARMLDQVDECMRR